jgi:hypothetical protein
LQDLEFCKANHPLLTPRAIAAQQYDPANPDLLALIEFECKGIGEDVLIKKRVERHFSLQPFENITNDDFADGKKRDDSD